MKKEQKKNEQKKEEKKEVPALPPPEQTSSFSTIKYMCLAFVALQISMSIYQFYFLFFPTIELDSAKSPYVYMNKLKHSQKFNISVNLLDHKSRFIQEIWNQSDLIYDYKDPLPITTTIQLPITSDMKNSHAVYAQAVLSAPNLYKGISREKPMMNSQRIYKKSKQPSENILDEIYWQSPKLNLIKLQKSFELVERSLIGGEMGESNFQQSEDNTLYPHFKSSISLTLMHDTHGYVEGEFEAKKINDVKIDPWEYYYQPAFFLTDFWTMRKHLVKINDTMEYLNLTLYFGLSSPGKLLMTNTLKVYESYPDMLEELKEVIVDTNFYLLLVTSIVTMLHMILDMLSFKNDIQFWMHNQSFKGISVKSVFVQIGFDVILFLYVLDTGNETSKYILFSMGIGMLIDMWKITRVARFSLVSSPPFVQITWLHEYGKSQTDDLDTQAMKFLSYLLFPLFLAYTVYSFLYKTHKGYYSFVIGSLAGGVYVFGFILMTPQLFINYKLKSVAQLPWRALFYRFLNTIIDDLFSFVMKMPVMHRIACFRDDVIFVIYIIQRYIYRVDPSRTDDGKAATTN